MLRCNGIFGLIALLCLIAPANLFAQIEDLIGDVVQVAVEADEEEEDDDENDGDVTREVTVEVQRDGRKITITQTVDGDFVGEIEENEETTAIKAESLDDLEEKFPAAHAAFTAEPANAIGKPGAAAFTEQQVTVNNDRRTVINKRPGRTETIKDVRGEDVEITIKQDLEHGTRTERYEADDLPALKKKFPEIAQRVPRNNVNGIINVQVQGAQFGNAPGVPGPRTIKGEHNGQKIVIRDEGGKNIRITLTKTEDGKNVTEEIEADDLDDLKKQNAEIAKVYEKLAGKAAPQPQFGIVGGNGVVNGVIQLQAGPAIPAKAIERAADAARLQGVKRLLEASQRRLEQLATDKKRTDGEALKKLAEEVADIAKKIDDLEAEKKE